MRRFYMMLCAAGAALALSACSANTAGGAAGAGDLASSGRGADVANVDEDSVEFFQVSVGDRVFFIVNQTDLTPEARGILDRQARWLQLNPEVQVVIEGHADERGTREYNLALGARRANAVRSYLSSQGVPASRMRAVTFGRERPVEICSREECWSKNRRAVTVVEGAN